MKIDATRVLSVIVGTFIARGIIDFIAAWRNTK